MNYDAIDIAWQWDGDFGRGIDGDLADTSSDHVQALVQEIQSVIRSISGDWKEHPTLAADLAEFRGEANTRENAERMKKRIISVLTAHNIVRREDLEVRIVPTHIHQVAILIKIFAQSTPNNSLVLGEPVVSVFIYDSVEDSVFYVPESKLDRDSFFK